jgi:hypothetical protein
MQEQSQDFKLERGALLEGLDIYYREKKILEGLDI